MKKFISLLVCLSQICPLARADGMKALKESVAQARQLRDELGQSYAPYMQAVTRTSIERHFVQRRWDHLSVRGLIDQRARRGIERLRELERDLTSLTEGIQSGGKDLDANLIHVFAAVAEIQMLLRESETLKRDLGTVQASWRAQCEDTRVQTVSRVYNPLSFQSLIEPDSVRAATPMIDLQPGLEISFGTSGDDPRPHVRPNVSGSDADAATVTVGIGLMVGGATVIGAVVLVGWALTRFGLYTSEVLDGADKESKLFNYLSDIRRIQLSALSQAGARVAQLSASHCEDQFPFVDGDRLQDPVLDQYATLAMQQWQAAREQRDALKQLYANRLDRIKATYLPNLIESFHAAVDVRSERAAKDRRAIAQRFKTIFAKDLLELHARTNTPEAWDIKDRIWTNLVDAEVDYDPTGGFSFARSNVDATGPALPDMWSQFDRKIREALK